MSFETAQPAEALLLEHAQQLGLQHQRDFADLVQEQRALVGQFEDAPLLRARVGERAFFVAEQLAFEQRFRDGRAVDGDEGLGLAEALVVQRLGDQVLAGAVLAFEQDGGGLADGDAPDESAAPRAWQADSAMISRFCGAISSVTSLMVATTPSMVPSSR